MCVCHESTVFVLLKLNKIKFAWIGLVNVFPSELFVDYLVFVHR